MKRLSILTVTVWIVLLSACASPREALLEEGATPYTTAELVALVSGKTEPWQKGAGYYETDGTLYARWEGVNYQGTWYATAKGTICLSVAEWQTSPCMDYFHRGDSVVILFKGRTATMSKESYLAGNRIGDF